MEVNILSTRAIIEDGFTMGYVSLCSIKIPEISFNSMCAYQWRIEKEGFLWVLKNPP